MKDTQEIRKVFFIWNFEQEEEWLNQMADEGWLLDKVGLCTYHFVRCEPGEYTVRMEMSSAGDDYIRFVEETGAKYIGHTLDWLYFCKKTEDGPFELLSDLDSRIKHLERIASVLKGLGLVNIAIGLGVGFSPANIVWINLIAASLMMYALGRIDGKTEALQKERSLRE